MFEFRLSKELKKRKVQLRFKEDIEPQEVLLDFLARKKEEETSLSEKKMEVPLFKKIPQGFLLFTFLLILILFGKTFQLQVIEGKNFSALAEGNRYIWRRIQAERGVIYDQYFNQLVFNELSFDLVVDIRNLPQDESQKLKVLRKISGIVNKDFESLEKEILESEGPQILIAESLDHQTLILLETKIEELTGFQIQANLVRNYQDGKTFSHLIGYTGKITTEELREREGHSIFDWVGRSGVERYYEEILRKNPGKLRAERDALGNIISKEVVSLPEPGKSIVLWLDSGLQKKIEEELEKSLKRVGSQKAAAVAIDPRTGGILTMISIPNFDNNLFQRGRDIDELRDLLADAPGLNPLFNRAISGQYPPGSTIKPFIAAAALEENLIDSQKQILTRGKIQIPHRYNPDIVYTFRDWKNHGRTDMRKAIAVSSNAYFYIIGGGYREQKGLLPTRMKNYLELFGWGSETGIGLPGEAKGLLPSPAWKRAVKKEGWWDGDTYLFSIGQGDVLATPLQLAVSTVPIANRGILYQPRVVKKIVDKEKNLVEEIKPQIIRQDFINPENLQVVREGMRQAITDGTVRMLNALPVKAAAKTGTAETNREGHYHHWVTIFAPYDEPEIVLTIMIENVKGLRAATVPVAQAVLEWYFSQERK